MPTMRCFGTVVHVFLTLKGGEWYKHTGGIYQNGTRTNYADLWLVLKEA